MRSRILMPGQLIKIFICLGFLFNLSPGLPWAQQGFEPDEDSANAQQKFSRVENAVQRLLEEISSLKAEKAQLEQQLAMPQAAARHSQELLELKQKYQGEVSELSEKLKQQQSAYESLEKSLQELARERNLLDEKMKSLEKRLAEEDKSGQMNRLKEEISSLKAKNAQLEQEVSGPAQKYRQATAELELRHRSQVSGLTKQITDALSERDSLKDKISSLSVSNAKLEKKMSESKPKEEELSAVKQESASLREEAARLKDKISSLSARNAELEKDRSADRTKSEVIADMEFQPMRKLPEIDLGQVNRQAHINLGYLYAHSDNLEEAIEEYKKALKYDGEDADAHYNLGWLYARKEMYPQAIKEFNLSLKSAAYQKEIYYNLTLIYLKYLNDAGKAGEYYKKYIDLLEKD